VKGEGVQHRTFPGCPDYTSQDESPFAQLALSLFALQFTHNAPYRRFCESRKISPQKISDWREIPAIPTSVFKELDLTALLPADRTRVFHSSGTTAQSPSRHFHSRDSLAIYEASLLAWFQPHFPRAHSPQFLALTPPPEAAPHSSLVHMFDMLRRELGSPQSLFTGDVKPDGAWELNLTKTLEALRDAIAAARPVTLFGTAFNFVHLLDHLAETNQRFALPPGSCVLETGGYKGRSRTLHKSELHALITDLLGIPATHIVCEYGMSELSSQAYDRTTADDSPPSPPLGERAGVREPHSAYLSQRNFHFPPWARSQIINPETGLECGEGETGLIRIFDLANVYSVMAVQTEDLGVRRGDGFELLGRAAQVELRGCSLMSV
jgi:hypothetical protein